MKGPREYKRWLAMMRSAGLKWIDCPRMEKLLANSKRRYVRGWV